MSLDSTLEVASPAKFSFLALVAHLANRIERRELLIRHGENLERFGYVVLWYKGLPLPDLTLLSDPHKFNEWLDLWAAADRLEVVTELPEFLSDLPDLCERLQIQRKLELSSPGRAVVMRQLTKVKEFVDALQSNYSAIVVNANYASQALV